MNRLILAVALLGCSAGAPVPADAADGCYQWSGAETLESVTDVYPCIDIAPGIYTVPESIDLWGTTVINGNGATLRAEGEFWQESPLRANDSIFIVHTGAKLTASGLVLDGANVASYLVTPGGYSLTGMTFLNGACSALGVMKPGAVVRNSTFRHHGWNCEPYSKVLLGAAIYGQHSNDHQYHFSPVITGNTFRDSNGPALDINGVWGGTFSNNNVASATGWAAVSLYGSSYWKITDNTISHVASAAIQDFHPSCVPSPARRWLWESHW